jgi:hypothetical protein
MSQKYAPTAQRTNRYARREQAQIDDAARVTAWRALSPSQQLASLDGRLGIGIGATRQRAKLAKAISNG